MTRKSYTQWVKLSNNCHIQINEKKYIVHVKLCFLCFKYMLLHIRQIGKYQKRYLAALIK